MTRHHAAVSTQAPPAAGGAPLADVLQYQSGWLADVLALQATWVTSCMTIQAEAVRQWVSGSQVVLAWAIWHNGTEQLA